MLFLAMKPLFNAVVGTVRHGFDVEKYVFLYLHFLSIINIYVHI